MQPLELSRTLTHLRPNLCHTPQGSSISSQLLRSTHPLMLSSGILPLREQLLKARITSQEWVSQRKAGCRRECLPQTLTATARTQAEAP